MRILRLFATLGLLIGASCFADVVTPFGQCPTRCEYLVVINPDHTTSLYYDAAYLADINHNVVDPEDILVGVWNNSNTNLLALSISSTNPESEFFDFDGGPDGNPDEPNFGYGPTGYEGPGTMFVLDPAFDHVACQVQFTPVFCYTGTVQMTGNGLAPGGITYFALEGSSVLDDGSPNGITVNGVSAIPANETPEPASLIMLGTGLCGIYGKFRNKLRG